ncbi:MAG: type IV secretion system DNA-binding domain-containing protein [Alphaproteobacteria bacterium]|nr:type IV secretion system DNA-binding domain-containing protein [Alphaproteobacteria bacterium]
MALDQRKYEHKHTMILRDIRPLAVRVADGLSRPANAALIFAAAATVIYFEPWALAFADLITLFMLFYFIWLNTLDRSLAFKLPMGARFKDGNNSGPGKNGKAEGILFLGNVEKTNEEVWFTNSDARTHVLYLGTTGAGKTEGLKSMVSNALAWGSGFVYVDGKADTDLWSSLSALCRRFGRDDDLLVLNYMTGNSDTKSPSNTMNPFSSGSASYLTNMLVSLMPESEGDNAMWKERAVSLASAMMPVMTWKRDNQDIPLSVRNIRDNLSLNNVVKLSRDAAVPEHIRVGMKGYLDTLPGFVADAFDENGQPKAAGPGQAPPDTTTASQQHGYLAMQFTRSLQSLGDDYGYIFDTQAADVDMVDVVLNRRILIVLIPALEKSGDEIANLGKIVAATMKGMMGSTLGSTVEGSSETVIENKPTHSATPFMTVFDEVGYYTAQGMAVMAAQARSLGFCLVFSGQDLPAMKKRVREEANSITANCNIKIFGKLEDPTETKDFFEKTVGTAFVTEVSSFQAGTGSKSYMDQRQASVQSRPRASYDGLRNFREGQAVITFGSTVTDCSMFYSNPGHAKAMRVTRYMALPPPDEDVIKHAKSITKLRDLLVNKTWSAEKAEVALPVSKELKALAEGGTLLKRPGVNPVDTGIAGLVKVLELTTPLDNVATGTESAPVIPAKPVAPATSPAASPLAQKPQGAAAPEQKAPPIFSGIPASPPAQPVTPPPAATGSAGPMGFFKKPGEESQSAPPSPPPAAVTPPPVLPLAPAEKPPVSAASTPEQKAAAPQKPKLPKEIQDIIDAAAKSARTEILKDEKSE